MADTHIINDKTESEQITLEEEASAIQEQEPQTDDRPEWLPDKFKTPEDLANAYNSLQGKLGSSDEQQQEDDLPPAEAPSAAQGASAAGRHCETRRQRLPNTVQLNTGT